MDKIAISGHYIKEQGGSRVAGYIRLSSSFSFSTVGIRTHTILTSITLIMFTMNDAPPIHTVNEPMKLFDCNKNANCLLIFPLKRETLTLFFLYFSQFVSSLCVITKTNLFGIHLNKIGHLSGTHPDMIRPMRDLSS